MLSFLTPKTNAGDKPDATLALPTDPRDFLPYYCHYDPHTLLTKNGELMQTIRITGNRNGLEYESEDGDAIVRASIRQALSAYVKSDRFSIWLHTVRKRRPAPFSPKYTETFPAYAQAQWQSLHPWKHHYYNEIYITLLRDGQSGGMADKDALQHAIMPGKNRAYRNQYLEQAHADLDQVTNAVLQHIQTHYRAERLGVVERLSQTLGRAAFYSEPMEFLGTLLNLRSEAVPLPEADVSAALSSTTLTFGFNALETKSPQGKRRFGALMTLKEYREIPPETADRILQAPMEFIISQSLVFVPSSEALQPYRQQKQLFDVSGDRYVVKASGLDEMLASNLQGETDFVHQQTTLMVMVDEFKHLEEELAAFHRSFAELGLITIREDIRQEDAFWAQFPGNFEFLRRTNVLNTARAGGFLRLNRFSGGTAKGNHWGDAVALVPSLVNTPYFFNFHYQDNGHTAIVDFNSFQDSAADVTLHFLLTASRHFDGRLYIFDRRLSAQLLTEKLGGHYHQFAPLRTLPNQRGTVFNPLTLERTSLNQSFLIAWCGALAGKKLSESQKASVHAALDQVYDGPLQHRTLAGLASALAHTEPELRQALSAWLPGGQYAGLLDASSETFDLTQRVHAFDMTPVVAHPDTVVPIFAYLMHRIINSLDGSPTLIVLRDAVDLLENAFFAPRLESLLEMLQQNNVAVIFTSSSPQEHSTCETFGTILRGCPTHLYLPDDVPADYRRTVTSLNEHDLGLLDRMERLKGDVLVKQPHEVTAMRIDVTPLQDVQAVYANDHKNLVAATLQFASQKAERKTG